MKTETSIANDRKDALMKKTAPHACKQITKTAKVSFANPVLQRTYDAAIKNIRTAKDSTPEQAREWMKRICAMN